MQFPHEVQEHLSTIRSMVERATVYRIISASSAIAAGIIALIAALSSSVLHAKGTFSELYWYHLWICVLILVSIINALLIAKKSKKESSVFFSSGLIHALKAIAPAMLTGGILSFCIFRAPTADIHIELIPAVWLTCYGLALLSMMSFSPPSLRNLGISCLALGLSCFIVVMKNPLISDHAFHLANFCMALGFGVFHIIYGFGVLVFNGTFHKKSPKKA